MILNQTTIGDFRFELFLINNLWSREIYKFLQLSFLFFCRGGGIDELHLFIQAPRAQLYGAMILKGRRSFTTTFKDILKAQICQGCPSRESVISTVSPFFLPEAQRKPWVVILAMKHPSLSEPYILSSNQNPGAFPIIGVWPMREPVSIVYHSSFPPGWFWNVFGFDEPFEWSGITCYKGYKWNGSTQVYALGLYQIKGLFISNWSCLVTSEGTPRLL